MTDTIQERNTVRKKRKRGGAVTLTERYIYYYTLYSSPTHSYSKQEGRATVERNRTKSKEEWKTVEANIHSDQNAWRA